MSGLHWYGKPVEMCRWSPKVFELSVANMTMSPDQLPGAEQ